MRADAAVPVDTHASRPRSAPSVAEQIRGVGKDAPAPRQDAVVPIKRTGLEPRRHGPDYLSPEEQEEVIVATARREGRSVKRVRKARDPRVYRCAHCGRPLRVVRADEVRIYFRCHARCRPNGKPRYFRRNKAALSKMWFAWPKPEYVEL